MQHDPEIPQLKRILVVDDDRVMLRLFQLQVKRSGCEGFFYSNPEAAIRQLASVRPEMAVLDYNLPGYTGIELYNAIRNEPLVGDIPVVFVTGSSETEALTELERTGAAAVLAKPFSPRRLQRLIEELLTRKNRSGEVNGPPQLQPGS